MSEAVSPGRGYKVAFWAMALLVIALDQGSKVLALETLEHRPPVEILPGLFDLRLEFNPGAAFSLFIGGRWVFVGVSLAALIFLPMYHRSLMRCGEWPKVYTVSVGMILGGAMGNAGDRVFREGGLVIDFFHAHWGLHSFPVFNVADSAITVGLGLLLFFMFLPERAEQDAGSGEGGAAGGEEDVAHPVQDRQF